MRTWPRILTVLICSLALMSTQHMVTAEAQECPGGYSAIFQLDGGEQEPRLGGSHQVIVAFMRDRALLGEGEGMARIINPGDKAGARRVFNITRIRVLTPPL